MSKLTFALILLAAGSVAHAETLHCVADELTYNIETVDAQVQTDGTLLVNTMADSKMLPSIIVKGTLDRFEVMAPQPKGNAGTFGINHVFVVNTGNRYVFETDTYCNPVYQEEQCIDPDQVIGKSIDTSVYCEKK